MTKVGFYTHFMGEKAVSGTSVNLPNVIDTSLSPSHIRGTRVRIRVLLSLPQTPVSSTRASDNS